MIPKISNRSEGSPARTLVFRQFVFGIVAMLFLCSLAAAQAINFVQTNSSVPHSASTLTAAFSSAQTAGDLNIVAIGWSDTTNSVTSVTDSKGNSYRLAVTYASTSLGITQSIYYASNIVAAAAGANTVTVQLSGSASFPDLRIAEYSGVNTLDKTSSAGGTATTADSGSIITAQATELLFGTDYTYGSTNGPGTGYTSRAITNNGDIVEDEFVSATGTYSATASMSGSNWVMQLATFYSSGGGGGVSVSISPTSATLNGGGTQQFTARVTGSSNTAVTWSLTGVGTLSTSGLYTAPATVANQTTATVKATSQADTTKSASATVTINPVAVSISPTSASVQVSQTQQFTATVTGTSNTAVTWQVNGTTGGNSTTGTVSTLGLYTAPASVPSPANVTVAAISQADTTKSASATVTVTAVAPALSITTASPLPNGTAGTAYSTTFAATGGTTPYTWTITTGSVPGLTLSSAGVLSGTPTTANTYTITVQATDSGTPSAQTASASFNVTINPPSTATSFYVAPAASGGSDTNVGSIASPWLTITHALNMVTVAGDTIYVRAGVYNERVVFPHSGSASGGQITLQSYPGELATVDGTGIAVGAGGYAFGLVDITGQSYVTVSGLEIRNFTGSGKSQVPAGIHVEGSGNNIQILNNHIHNIMINGNSCNTTNGFGLIVVGTNGTAPMTNLTISGNELDHMVTGCSETMTVNGNVQYFTISNNKVHDNNNIGIAALGGEGVASGYSRYNGSPNDQARNGTISGNIVYNISSNNNPVYKGACNCADGIYLDGSAYVIVERNVVHNVDINEVAGEGSGQNTDHNTVRDNLFYSNGVTGLSIGGQTNVGSASNVTVVNNTFFGNGTYGVNISLGEFTTGINLTGVNIFENNILYAGPTGVLLKAVTTNSITLDYNLYYSTASPSWIWGSSTYTSFASYKTGTGQDAHSLYGDPQFLSTTSTPPNLDISSTSPANDTGINLGSAVVGTLDYAGNPRVQGAGIEIGAYEH